jgi:type IV pilus assembly protein PilM
VSDSFWKKEISFGRKPKREPEAELDVAPAVKAVLEPEAAEAPDTPEAPAEPPVSAPPTSPAPAWTVTAEAPLPLPAVTGDYGWLTESFDPNDVPEAMPTVVAPLVSLPSQPAPLVSQPAPAVAPEPEPAPQVEPEPEPELEPPPAASSARAPFWKKELSFSRGSKEPKPAKVKEPKAKKTKEPKEKAAPFWKKELSLSRGSKEPTVATETETEAVVPTEKKPPLWKRELKLSKPKLERAPKETKEQKQPREKKQKGVRSSGSAGKGAAAKGAAAKNGLVGLKIGASQVAAARVTSNGSPQLLQVARVPLAEGVVVGGELRDVEALAQTLKELFAKHKLPKRGVRLGIANNRIGVRTFEIAGIEDEKQLANAIRFRAQETLPIPLEEAVLDWKVLSERTDEEGKTMRRVLLVVAYRELVDQYVAACKKAGIKLSGIDLEAFAMLRALSTQHDADAGEPTAAQVIVNVGHDRSTFAVTDGVQCEFTRVLGWGGHSLSTAIAGALDIELEAATPIKHQISLVTGAAAPEDVDQATLETAREAVRRELQSFARELVSSLRFYQNQPGSLGIGEVVLTGGTAHLPGFDDELHRLIGVPVRVGDPLNRVAVAKKFKQDDDYSIGSLTIAIGLGIDD